MGTETVTLSVGKKRKEFTVHKKLICDASKFFNDAFNGPFKEGVDGIMYMPEDDPGVIAYFVDWLYRNPIPQVEDSEKPKVSPITVHPVKPGDVQFGPPTKAEHENKLEQAKMKAAAKEKALQARLDRPFDKLFKLYYFAEKLFMKDLKNQTMDCIRRGLHNFKRHLIPATYKQVYDNTSKGSQLRVFCTEYLAYDLAYANDEMFENIATAQEQSPELSRDLLAKMKVLLADDMMSYDYREEHPDPTKCGWGCDYDSDDSDAHWGHNASKCQFHDHEGDEEAEKQCFRQFTFPCNAWC